MNTTNTTTTTNAADVFEAYSKLKECIASLNEIKAIVRELVHIDCEMEQAFGTLMSFASKNGVTTGALMEDLAKAKILHKIVDEIDDVIWFNMPADRDEREAKLEEQKDEIVAAIEVKKTLGEDEDLEDEDVADEEEDEDDEDEIGSYNDENANPGLIKIDERACQAMYDQFIEIFAKDFEGAK